MGAFSAEAFLFCVVCRSQGVASEIITVYIMDVSETEAPCKQHKGKKERDCCRVVLMIGMGEKEEREERETRRSNV